MARTINGKMTGRAASTDLRDLRERLSDEANPNSPLWKWRLSQAFAKIRANRYWAEVWDSHLVPEKASYRRHTELANQIIAGELTLPKTSTASRKKRAG